MSLAKCLLELMNRLGHCGIKTGLAALLQSIRELIAEVKKGRFGSQIRMLSHNPNLQALVEALNTMSDVLRQNICAYIARINLVLNAVSK